MKRGVDLRERAIDTVMRAIERQFFPFGGHDPEVLRAIAIQVVSHADAVAIARVQGKTVEDVA